MFVQTNSIQSIKTYFKDRLKEKFTENEIKTIVRESVMERLKISSSDYLLSDQLLFSESDLLYFRSVSKRLMNNEPFQHIIGKTEFFGLDIKTDSRALIPRPETEELVEWIISDHEIVSEYQILDLCTGTGCIPLALKSILEKATIQGIDISSDALDLAKENAVSTKLEVQFSESNLLLSEGYKDLAPNYFDVWVSNPPYIPNSDKKSMDSNVVDFEPEIALFVDDHEPLVFYSIICEKAMVYLKQKGLVYFEIHENLGNEMIQLLGEKGFVNIELRKDLQGKNRMIKAQKP